jgi:NAD(P)-dependent dehydrogenase (short-subunit alcohol dehydrogenase family)
MLLSNNVAIITGGGRGIGKGIALKFAEEGCSTVIADVLVTEGKQTAGEISAKGRAAIFLQCDVSNSRQVQDMVEQVIGKFGKVDILVNNAGIGPLPRSIMDVSEEDWDRVLDINLKGVFLCCKAVVPHMKKKRYGKIINISSMGAIAPPAPDIHYTSAKAGILGFTRDLALELAPFGICVNAILPGAILTDMYSQLVPPGTNEEDFFAEMGKTANPMGRMGTPEDIAGAALFLASGLSGFVTGDRILVGGGSPLRMKFAVKRTTEGKNG